MSKTEMVQRVLSRLAADLSTPAYTGIHDNNLYRWANEEVSKIIDKLEPVHYFPLVVIGTSLGNTGPGQFTLPTSYYKPLAVRVTASQIQATLFVDPQKFSLWDSHNFVLTPSTAKPVALVADAVYVKPTSITVCYFDCVVGHPDIATMPANTNLSNTADAILVDLVAARCFGFLEEFEAQANAIAEAWARVGGK